MVPIGSAGMGSQGSLCCSSSLVISQYLSGARPLGDSEKELVRDWFLLNRLADVDTGLSVDTVDMALRRPDRRFTHRGERRRTGPHLAL